MKRLVMMIAILALAVSLIGVIPASGETDDNELVYKSAMIDGGHSSTAYGYVMVWANGEVKVKLFVEGETGKTYDVAMDYGSPNARLSVILGAITTDKKGRAIEYFDLSDTGLYIATTPGFVVRARGVPPGPGSAVASTGFLVPSP